MPGYTVWIDGQAQSQKQTDSNFCVTDPCLSLVKISEQCLNNVLNMFQHNPSLRYMKAEPSIGVVVQIKCPIIVVVQN